MTIVNKDVVYRVLAVAALVVMPALAEATTINANIGTQTLVEPRRKITFPDGTAIEDLDSGKVIQKGVNLQLTTTPTQVALADRIVKLVVYVKGIIASGLKTLWGKIKALVNSPADPTGSFIVNEINVPISNCIDPDNPTRLGSNCMGLELLPDPARFADGDIDITDLFDTGVGGPVTQDFGLIAFDFTLDRIDLELVTDTIDEGVPSDLDDDVATMVLAVETYNAGGLVETTTLTINDSPVLYVGEPPLLACLALGLLALLGIPRRHGATG